MIFEIGQKLIRLCCLCGTWQEFEVDTLEHDPCGRPDPSIARAKSTHQCCHSDRHEKGLSRSACKARILTVTMRLDPAWDRLPTAGLDSPVPPLTCVRCRRTIFEEEVLFRKWFKCCEDFHQIGRCCTFRDPSFNHWTKTEVPQDPVEWLHNYWTPIHTPVCAHRCADCGIKIEYTKLTWGCGGSIQKGHETCMPTRCNDCFTLHRISGLCVEEGKSKAWRSCAWTCPYCYSSVVVEKGDDRACVECEREW